MAKQRQLFDWIDGYIDLTNNTEAPRSYRFWTGASMVAAALQRKCWMQFGLEPNYANMYIVLVGPSGARKGTAMRPGQAILREVGIPLAPDIITHQALIGRLKKSHSISILNKRELVDGQLVSKEQPVSHCSLTIFSEELTVFLGYNNAEFVTSLIDWYDCKDNWKYETKNMGDDHIIGVWVNLLGATTPDLLTKSLPREAVGGGLLSRIVFVYESKKGKTVPWPTLSLNQVSLREKLKNDLEVISIMGGEFVPNDQWLNCYMDWYIEQEKTKAIADPRLESYLTRRATHIRKLSMLLCASRTDSMILEKRDFDRSLREMESVEKRMHLVFSGLGQARNIDVMSRVMATIASQGRITMTDLMKLYYYDADKDTMVNIVATLVVMKFCKEVMTTSGAFVEYIPKEKTSSE